MSVTKFEAGKTYYNRSICDHDCIFKITVISRTDKTIKVLDNTFNTVKSLRVSTKYTPDCEQVKPHGSYSMAATINADEVFN